MANQKVLEQKQEIINEIENKVQNSDSVIFFEYQGLTALEAGELRRKLRETGSEFKVYKNTLVKRALTSLKLDLPVELEGPKAIAFGTDAVAPIKVLSDFAKDHPALVLKVGLVDDEIADEAKLKQLSSIPSRDALLTMLAGSLMASVRNLSIGLDMYSKQLEN